MTKFKTLIDAVKKGDHRKVRKLSEHKKLLNLQDEEGWTALTLACVYCKRDSSMKCVRELLKAGADVNLQDNVDGWTALMLACRNCNKDSSIECVRELLQAGADVNLQDNNGFTALMMACRNCNGDSSIECVRELLKAGADVNLQDNNGWTALMMACRYCNGDSSMECVRELLQAGADWTMLNNNGSTAKDLTPNTHTSNVKNLLKETKIEHLTQKIVKQVHEEMWAYGGVGYELLQLKNQLLGMQ